MAKQKKKRNKKYTGADARVTHDTVIRVQAVNRSKLGQWWFEKKTLIRRIAIGGVVVAVIVLLLVELVRVLF